MLLHSARAAAGGTNVGLAVRASSANLNCSHDCLLRLPGRGGYGARPLAGRSGDEQSAREVIGIGGRALRGRKMQVRGAAAAAASAAAAVAAAAEHPPLLQA